MMIKRFVGKFFAAVCALLLLSMSGALSVAADTVRQPDGAAQDGNGEKEAQRLMIREPR